MNKKKKDLEETCQEYLAGWKRALADYENIQKDLLNEKKRIRNKTTEDLAMSLVPVLDNFDHATKFQPENLDDKARAWFQGIVHVHKQLEEVFSSMGVDKFGEAGENFDPSLHDATGEVTEPDKADQTITQVVLSGWKIKDRVIRPAKVIVNNLSNS